MVTRYAAKLEEENIIKILGIESWPDEKKTALVEDVTELVQKRLMVRLLDSLKEPQYSQLLAILDKQEEGPLNDFLQKNQPNFADWAYEEVTKIKKELKDLAAKIP